jgi:hypothetical protein
MSTFAVPVLVTVTVWLWVFPTVVLPKSSDAGFKVNWPTGVAVPVPVRATLATESEALLATESVALKLPLAFGEKATLIGVLCPAEMVAGRAGEVSEKYLAEMATLLTVMDVLPPFVAVTVMVLVVPAGTLPKSIPLLASERTLDMV